MHVIFEWDFSLGFSLSFFELILLGYRDHFNFFSALKLMKNDLPLPSTFPSLRLFYLFVFCCRFLLVFSFKQSKASLLEMSCFLKPSPLIEKQRPLQLVERSDKTFLCHFSTHLRDYVLINPVLFVQTILSKKLKNIHSKYIKGITLIFFSILH